MALDRRAFVALAAAGALSGRFPETLLGASRRRRELTLLRRNVGTFSLRGGTIGWLVNGDGVLVVDSQFADTAPTLLEGLRERSPRTIDVLINTHHHPDHTGGNGVLREATRSIVAHTRSAENQRNAPARGGGAPPTLPDVTFDDSWSAEIGDETVHAKHYGPAHTGGDAAIYFERANVVHMGDLINNRGYANVDGPAGASVHGWVRALEAIAPEYPADAIYIFGHGEPEHGVTGTRADLMYQRDYFTTVIEAARRARAEGRSREEVVGLRPLPGFESTGGQVARLGLALGIAYDELGG